MANDMNCPACGAAIDFSAGRDKTRCDYCGSALQIVEEGGKTRLQLLSQPELQRNFMPDGIQDQGFGAYENKPDDEPLEPESIAPDKEPPGIGTPPYPNMTTHVPERIGGQPVGEGEGTGSSRRWIAVVVAAVVVLCVLCACIVGAVVIAGNLFVF